MEKIEMSFTVEQLAIIAKALVAHADNLANEDATDAEFEGVEEIQKNVADILSAFAE